MSEKISKEEIAELRERCRNKGDSASMSFWRYTDMLYKLAPALLDAAEERDTFADKFVDAEVALHRTEKERDGGKALGWQLHNFVDRRRGPREEGARGRAARGGRGEVRAVLS